MARTGNTKYGHKRNGNTGHRDKRLSIAPIKGGVGTLEASRGRVRGRKASRLESVPMISLRTASWENTFPPT